MIFILSLLFISHSYFLNNSATSEIYTLSLHDALPILISPPGKQDRGPAEQYEVMRAGCGHSVIVKQGEQIPRYVQDRKSTRLNSSHQIISYAVFCLKKKSRRRVLGPDHSWSTERTVPE